MKVEEILRVKGPDVFQVHVDAIVHDALLVMVEKNVGSLLVVDDAGAVQGIITERDIMRSCSAVTGNVRGQPVKEVMTPRTKLLVAHPGDDIANLMALMTDKHIRHLPIVGEAGRPEGMISIGDIVKAVLVDRDMEIRHLQDYIEYKYPL
jgi:CBS domain-containing protein